MSTTKNSVTLTFGYADTDYTRKYKFDNVADEELNSVKDKILEVNGNANGIGEVFISEDGQHGFTGIVAAQIDSVEEEIINLNV